MAFANSVQDFSLVCWKLHQHLIVAIISKRIEFKMFNKTIIPLILIGYNKAHIQCALME